MKLRFTPVVALAATVVLAGCSLIGKKGLDEIGSTSSKTGVDYKDYAGLSQAIDEFKPQEAPPGMVFIHGGTFIMGGSEENIAYSNDNSARQVTVSNFYMDYTEVSNLDWKEFVYQVSQDSSQTYAEAVYPDTTVWMRDLAYNDPLLEYYYSHLGFSNYPVVGVNWYQANAYCKWRSDWVNLQRSTKNPNIPKLPNFRLPTEAEWEYAARGGLEQTLYPWEGKSLRDMDGMFMSNFKHGRGNYSGQTNQGVNLRAGKQNDGAAIPYPVMGFPPNDFGLYNMAGNVAEWTYDTYRVLSYEDVEDLNPSRRRGKSVREVDTTTVHSRFTEPDNFTADGEPTPKPDQYSLGYNPSGDYGDADRSLLYRQYTPNVDAGSNQAIYTPTAIELQYYGQPGYHDNVKVYRGGSWADIAYYISTGTRRYQYADQASNTIGFRCAMIGIGTDE